RSFAAGVTIFRQGDQGDAFYLIQAGTVQVVVDSGAGNSETVAVLGPRDWFGEMALMSGEPRSATIVAIKDATLWRLSREDWDELIKKDPTWLLQFCATLSKRLSYVDRQYSTGREAFNSLAEEFYHGHEPKRQEFLRHAVLLHAMDDATVGHLFQSESAAHTLADLRNGQSPLLRQLANGRLEFHSFFKDFLHEKLRTIDGGDTERRLHAEFAKRYAALGDWQQAIRHAGEIEDWPEVIRVLKGQRNETLASAALFTKNILEHVPREHFIADTALANLRGDMLIQLGDLAGAFRFYQEVLAQRAVTGEAVTNFQRIAETLARRKEYGQAIAQLRSALSLADGNLAAADYSATAQALPARFKDRQDSRDESSHAWQFSTALLKSRQRNQWLGDILGLAVGGWLWFWQPDIGLEPSGTQLLGLIAATLIFWVFDSLPDYGVALAFAMIAILTKLDSATTVMGGFASTTWFMTLGVLGLGVAITRCGLFYRMSLHLVRLFPLSFHWQIVATGIMGVVVMALIPQQSARTMIISQMLINLSESLGYKTPSTASTGLFAASFLGLGQLGFLFLTGSTTSLIAWGLLPPDVREQFSWGYWFIAALPPTLV
ncbi:MAG: cyclic nucleotide-binding domain-containing protein, partial [Deltaproteobacteria bacterium]|nr:cyclic nucleotide-binding domain-containing protein [Deltaproteobacteria bacterium]